MQTVCHGYQSIVCSKACRATCEGELAAEKKKWVKEEKVEKKKKGESNKKGKKILT